MKRRAIKITRDRAIQIASNHNCVSIETARNLYGLHGYIDGLRDMYPLMKYGNVPE